MIAEVFLGLISLGILGAFCFYVWDDRKSHQKMINAIKAGSPQEMFNLDMGDNLKVMVPKGGNEPTPSAFTPVEDIPDDEYIANITGKAPDTSLGEDDGQE